MADPTMYDCAVCGAPFTWQAQRGRRPMTCSPACRSVRKNQQSDESRARARARGCPDDLHGTSAGYSHYGCDCAKCCAWSRGDKRRRRHLAKINN